ncbi:mitochondrial oxaloacetate transporter [Phellopilus nigrolimitatus]|nr:mitochondrial oxaloacetate transporter [Phellopilus nigrolimitatus]
MQPADTRLPNGKTVGTLYKNPFDCLWKTFKTEGPLGWYKGSTAHFLRIAPHTIITLTANDLIIDVYKTLRDGKTLTD